MKKEIINMIIDKLYDYEGGEIYSCDLAYTLFEAENIDGTMTYSSWSAKEWIKNNFDDIGEVWEELKFQFGDDYVKDINIFDEPEKFMVIVVLESASYLLSRCKTINENWNDKIKLNKTNIKKIEKELKELDNGGGIYEI